MVIFISGLPPKHVCNPTSEHHDEPQPHSRRPSSLQTRWCDFCKGHRRQVSPTNAALSPSLIKPMWRKDEREGGGRKEGSLMATSSVVLFFWGVWNVRGRAQINQERLRRTHTHRCKYRERLSQGITPCPPSKWLITVARGQTHCLLTNSPNACQDWRQAAEQSSVSQKPCRHPGASETEQEYRNKEIQKYRNTEIKKYSHTQSSRSFSS